MDELMPSDPQAGTDELRETLVRQGYIYIPNALPTQDLGFATEQIHQSLVEFGLETEPGILTDKQMFNPTLHRRAVKAASQVSAFNRLTYLPEVQNLARRLLGEHCYPLPSKVLRASVPAVWHTEPGRYAHQDFSYWGVNDMVTVWVPLMDIPLQVGGLAIRSSSHLGKQQPLTLVNNGEPGWASTNYRLGDIVIFHCLTAHGALPNDTGSVRLSGDFRWVRIDEPVAAELVVGKEGNELFANNFAAEEWWQPIPEDVVLVPDRPHPPGRSSFFPVHAEWETWTEPQPPSAPNQNVD